MSGGKLVDLPPTLDEIILEMLAEDVEQATRLTVPAPPNYFETVADSGAPE